MLSCHRLHSHFRLSSALAAVQDIFQALCDAAALNPDSVSEGELLPNPGSPQATVCRLQPDHTALILHACQLHDHVVSIQWACLHLLDVSAVQDRHASI